jgi:hypothetical protein
MEEDCGGGEGLSWAVEPKGGGERERERELIMFISNYMNCIISGLITCALQ